ncbi:MAG: hypothetical protein IKH78_03890 [Ruminococcus sp.]|nr:hypothetical protein [Ruminococcus sp.]
MHRRIRNTLSAMTAAVVCAVSCPAVTADSGVIIDHNTDGVENGYSYEFINNDPNSTPVMELSNNASFECSWDNKESFSSSRGLRFAAPVKYSELGSISVKYWRMIQAGSYTDKEKGYVRFGIRLHNSKGDTITILELDDSADGQSIAGKDNSLGKLGQLTATEVFSDYNVTGPQEGDSFPVDYTLYSAEDKDGKTSYICRRDTPLGINNESDDFRSLRVSETLDAMAEAGFDPGEITDISLFAESAYCKGSANIMVNDISVENMPDLAPDEYEEGNILVKGNGSGSRDGYYYDLRTRTGSGEMELVSPSLFRAGINTANADYYRPDVFERGYKFREGQNIDHVMGSKVDYEMNFAVEGSYFVGTHISFNAPETESSYNKTNVYIVDASVDWKVPEDAECIGSAKVKGEKYPLYHTVTGIIGSGKGTREDVYYFVSPDAESSGKNGTVSVHHDLDTFIFTLYECNYKLTDSLNMPVALGVQLSCTAAKGSAELIRSDITVPENPKENSLYEYMYNRINLDNNAHWSHSAHTIAGGRLYDAYGYTVYMNGYPDEPIQCEWNSYDPTGEDDPYPGNRTNRFSVGNNFGTYSIIDRKGILSYYGDDELIIDYSIDIGKIRNKTGLSNWQIGVWMQCMRDPSVPVDTGSPYEELLKESNGVRYISIVDKWGVSSDPTGDEIGYYEDPDFYPTKDLGTITSDGVSYNVQLMISRSKDASTTVKLIRTNVLASTEADDVPADHERYENQIDLSDIMRKLRAIGLDFGGISEAEFSLSTYDTEGSAIINRAGFKQLIPENRTYTAEEIQTFSDFLLGKSPRISAGYNYDLNGDGRWDSYDLCLMKSRPAPEE